MHPEKNDININKLFDWGNKFEIKRGNEVLVNAYIRLIGDADLYKARVFGLRSSTDLRKRLKDKNSDEYIVFISFADELDDKTGLINLLTSVMTHQVAQEALKEIRLPMPKEPKSDASLEEQEKFQAEVDSYDERRNELVGELILKKLNQLQEFYDQKSLEDLRKIYVTELTKELCEREMMSKYKEMCVFLGTYKDENYSEHLFNSFEEFTNLVPEIKAQFIDAYDVLDLNIEELKKSLEAMQ